MESSLELVYGMCVLSEFGVSSILEFGLSHFVSFTFENIKQSLSNPRYSMGEGEGKLGVQG